MSNLACVILRRIGIPAEPVDGKFIGSDGGHCYIEAYFPDAGWVFYDLSNGDRGFKSLDCLMTVGYAFRSCSGTESKWTEGHFCVEKDAAPYKEGKPGAKMRATPKEDVAAALVTHAKAPAGVRVRQESISQVLADLSIAPGKREYVQTASPATQPAPKKPAAAAPAKAVGAAD